MKIVSPRYPQCHAQNTDMMILLGRAHLVDGRVVYPNGNKWPDAGLPVTEVQGISVWVRPIMRVPGKKSSKHRVMCMCPKCAQVMSAGRLHQHKCPKEVA